VAKRSLGMFVLALLGQLLLTEPRTSAETPDQARQRHDHVAQRRAGVHLICHRGALEFAHENTMEAYRAALDLGADGNEIDIRITKDGVLVCFHDDMLDHLLEAYGDVGDYTWEELQKVPFRHPGRFGKHCRIPTLREVFEFHRDHHALVFLDVKQPNLADAIGRLLDEYDLWDHVVQAPADFTDPRIVRTRSKGEMYLTRTEVDDKAITAMLARPGEQILLESPQKVALALGRKIGPTSAKPVSDEFAVWARQSDRPADGRSSEELLKVLNDAADWNEVANEGPDAASSAERILKRAKAADELARRGAQTPEVVASLEQRVHKRSLHRDWRYCGLDGCAALRALFALKAPQATELARSCLWRDDPDVEKAMNPMYKNPRSWTDFRTKIPVFKMLETMPGSDAEKICRDYLVLSDEEAHRIGVPLFEDAARCLIAVSPHDETMRELSGHRLSIVRGRAILESEENRTRAE
jgi:glycerophosphoryl diester phosphodiesterase